MKKIHLSVKRSVFRSDDPEKDMADAGFKKIRPEILKRDDNTCQYCGFKADKFQEVHHLDDNHSNNDESNLVTACAICHANHHLGFSGIKGRGSLIYINPEWGMRQEYINNIARQLWVAEGSDNPEIELLCSNVISRLERCALDAKKLLGTNELSMLADFYLRLNDEQYSNRSKVLEGVFVMPRKDGFSTQVEYWRKLPFLSLKKVESVAKQRLEQWSNSDGTILELCSLLGIETY